MFKILKINNIKYKLGNTMSETLIALTIVGIVFTISMGTIVSDLNRNHTAELLKNAYSNLTSAFNYAIVHNGSPENWNILNDLSGENSYKFFKDYLSNSIITMKDCKTNTTDDCSFKFKELDGTEKELNSSWTRFFLNNGTFIALQTNSNSKYKVVYMYIDINGKRRLNVVGRDIYLFEFWIQNPDLQKDIGRLLPFGHQYSREELISDKNPNNCNERAKGNYCSALIMKDSWQIIKGYPWAHARYIVK